MMSMRADFFGELQRDERLYAVHRLISVPPLRETELREVVSRPAELLSARFETNRLAADIAQRAADESTKDAGALPLLSYLLDDMWAQMVRQGDGILRLPAQAIELGTVLVDRADAFLAAHPDSEELLRRVFSLKLATVREGEEATRRRALRSEFSDEEWRLISDLADHPNRLLITATPEGGEAYAEVAHEAIFRRWGKLRDWISGEREFLIWKSGLENARRAWQSESDGSKHGALLMGLALRNAQSRIASRAQDVSSLDRQFVALSSKAERQRKLRTQVAFGVPALVILVGMIGWLNEGWVRDRWRWLTVIRPYMTAQVQPYVLSAEAERALKPTDSFKECAGACPEMVVVPAGSFMMGSPATEPDRDNNESDDAGRPHAVAFSQPFAISKFEVTFDEWNACVAYGDCPEVSNNGWGGGKQPVINVSWDDAETYVKWLARMTGKPYRLPSEAEWEYVERAGTQTAYSWGDEFSKGHANCNGCGSQWDNLQPAPVGSFAADAWGLYDMQGNVWQWVEDCYHDNYDGAPTDGSLWQSGDCRQRVMRGGSCYSVPRRLRSADRQGKLTEYRGNDLGFRVGRTL
jgi:formylglycine-generating enzyme required for sulfatase activity